MYSDLYFLLQGSLGPPGPPGLGVSTNRSSSWGFENHYSLWGGILEVPCSLAWGLGSGLEALEPYLGYDLCVSECGSPKLGTSLSLDPKIALGVAGPTYTLILFLALQGKGLPGPPVSIYCPLGPSQESKFPEQPSLKPTLYGISQIMA